jgi:hypothetical protein
VFWIAGFGHGGAPYGLVIGLAPVASEPTSRAIAVPVARDPSGYKTFARDPSGCPTFARVYRMAHQVCEAAVGS